MKRCGKPNGLSAKLIAEVDSKMNEVSSIFGSTSKVDAVILNFKDLIYHSSRLTKDGRLTKEDLQMMIINLKKTTQDFAETFDQGNVKQKLSIVHIKGMNTLFSCYVTQDDVITLAFYTKMTSEQIAKFDTTAADKKMETVLSDLKLLLTGIMVPPKTQKTK